jgi:diaminopimelate decarboxylase
MTLTRHVFGAVSKYSGVAVNTRPPLVPTSVVEAIDGCAVSALVARFGSPLFVVSEDRLRQEFRDLRAAFAAAHPAVEIAYSYKTNYLTGLRAILHQEGAGAEVVSGLEYEMAARLGVPGARIVFNGPYKTPDDLRRAARDGARINLDSLDELAVLQDVARAEGLVVPVGVRVSAAVTEAPWVKFGFGLEAGLAEEACRRVIEAPSLRLAGLHAHLGTDLAEPRAYVDLIDLAVPLMARLERRHGVCWEVLDLGGGLPNRHRHACARAGTAPEQVFPAFAGPIGKALAGAARRLQSRPRLVLEPGRALVEHAVFLVTSVGSVKRLPGGPKAAILDAGVHLLPTAYYTALEVAPSRPAALSVEEVTLYGPLCMQVDRLATGLRLPPLRRGDHLVVKDCGAYADSQSMQFIQPRPAVVLVSAGRATLLREAERAEHFLERDRLPERLRQPLAHDEGRSPAGSPPPGAALADGAPAPPARHARPGMRTR